MTPNEAGVTVRGWIDGHTRAVLNTLACAGVPLADRPDLAQDVFLTAYGILLRNLFPVAHPRAWLCAIAKRRAMHFRREPGRRLCLAPVDDAPSDRVDPERDAEDRELVRLLLTQLGEEACGVILDLRAEGLSWEEVARERGLTVPQARYVYRVALQQMEAARGELTPASRRSFVLAAALGHTFDRLRAEAALAPTLHQRLWASIAEAVHGAPPMPANGLESGGGPRSFSIRLYAPPGSMSAASAVGLLAGGVALGVLIASLLRPAVAAQPVLAPADSPASTSGHTLADEGPTRSHGSTQAAAFTPAGLEERRVQPESPVHVAVAGKHAGPGRAPRKRPRGPFALLDEARAAVAVDDALAALAPLEQHAHRFAHGPGAPERQHLLRMTCAIPSAREAPACVDLRPRLRQE